jgi:uncharacterized damage-inducible protein DinB
MAKWLWIERTFSFDFPVEKWPDLLERVRGTPARIEERVARLSREVLTHRPSGGGWSIQENIGHLIDLGYLPLRRIEQILAGEKTLLAADMANKKTHEADHNARPIAELLAEFRADRAALVARFESLSDADWSRSALHPRIQQPMRIVDIAYFDAEHDDYHLGRIGERIRLFSSNRRP